ncbi:MAG: hypothetical protein JF600_18235, partial [Xanthomonadales bacterium]|nr:hypothetical protein [Xanthomonadales bacterium]
SARTEAQLRQKARDLAAFVRERADVDLGSLAYTLQVGREAMEERLALVVEDAATLVERLSAFAEGAEEVEDLHVGQAKRYREVMSLFATDAALQEAVGRWLSEGRLEQVAGLWTKGLEVTWSRLYPARSPRRMSLPTYPFARERHWLEIDGSAPAMATATTAAALHPLLQQNLSDLYRQRYRSRFDGREAFAPAGVLDGGVLVEMLRAAVARSLGAASDEAVQLQDVAWTGEVPVPCALDVEVTAQDDGTVQCVVLAASDDDAVDVEIHASAIGALVEAERPSCDLADAQSRLATADGGETYRGAGEVLRRVQTAADAWSDHALPQPWWEAALHASSLLGGDAAVEAVGVPELCVHAPLAATGWAWVRATEASDVVAWTLCDAHGTVCVEAFVDIQATVPVEDSSARDPVWSIEEGVEVHDLGDGIQAIRMSTVSADGARNVLTPALCAALAEAFAAVSARAGLRAVVLEGTDETFAQGDAEACAAMVASGLVAAIVACPVPVLSVCAGDAVDAGWWLASLGDQLVASEEGRYGYGPGTLGLQASQAALMRARHGASVALRAALDGAWSGARWREAGCAFAVSPRASLPSQVAQWTQALSDKPEEALRLLKAHLTQAQRAAAVPAWPVVAVEGSPASGDQRGVVLWSASTPFDGAIDADALLALSARIADAPVPVVAALSSSAQGAAWAWSLDCDAAAYAGDQHYGTGEDLFADARLAQTAAWLVPARLGVALGRELLLAGEALTGAALAQRSGSAVLAMASDQVLSQAQALCASLSASGSAASSWKRERAAWREASLSSRPAWTPAAEVAMAAPGRLALESPVVSATLQADGVLLVELQDHEAKNMFSEALVSGVREAFAQVPASGCRVVVVTGTGRYFASGGTRESLLAIQSGEAKFTDYAIYGLPLQCEVPVIAAMQGHGIGAGWSLGMHADVVLHAEEG